MFNRNDSYSIDKAIMHVLDKGGTGRATFSDITLDLAINPEFNEFLNKHAYRCINSSTRRSAIYRNPMGDSTRPIFEDIISSDDDNIFIQKSKDLGNRMFTHLRENMSCDFVILRILNETENIFLTGVILFDFTKNFFHEIDDTIPGVTKVLPKNDILSLPTHKKIKKFAIIGTFNETEYINNTAYYNILTDLQSRDTRYFFNDFLKAEYKKSNNEITSELYDIFSDYDVDYDNNISDIYLDLIEGLETFSIDQFIDTHIREDDDKDIIKNILGDRGIIENEITLDPQYINDNLKRIVYNFDNEMVIRIRRDFNDSIDIQNNDRRVVISDAGLVNRSLKSK